MNGILKDELGFQGYIMSGEYWAHVCVCKPSIG